MDTAAGRRRTGAGAAGAGRLSGPQRRTQSESESDVDGGRAAIADPFADRCRIPIRRSPVRTRRPVRIIDSVRLKVFGICAISRFGPSFFVG